jgi:uncharacterized UPF0160 family protein
MIEKLHKSLYRSIILEVDCGDTGVEIADNQKYSINSGLPQRIDSFNSPWNAPKDYYNQHNQFKKAMKVAEAEFLRIIYGQVVIKLPAYEIVKKAYDSRHEFHQSGSFLYFESYAPW